MGGINMKQFNLQEYLKNPTRKVITRDGMPVKIHCTNYTKNHFIIAEIEGTNCSESFTKDGQWLNLEDSEKDLFFATEKHEGWINIYEEGKGFKGEYIYSSEKEAFNAGKHFNDYIATAKIEWEE